MGRGKVPIQFIEDNGKRQVTFSKRRKGLIKKATEISILCKCEVALMIFSNTNKMYEYRSCDRTMDSFATMHRNTIAAASSSKSASNVASIILPEDDPDVDVATLREALIELRRSYNQMLGIGLQDMKYYDLHNLEMKLIDVLRNVRAKKEQIFMAELSVSNEHVREMEKENEELRKEVEELQQCLMSKSSGSGSESSSLKRLRADETGEGYITERKRADASVMTDDGYITGRKRVDAGVMTGEGYFTERKRADAGVMIGDGYITGRKRVDVGVMTDDGYITGRKRVDVGVRTDDGYITGRKRVDVGVMTDDGYITDWKRADAGVMMDEGYITEKEFESDDILNLG